MPTVQLVKKLVAVEEVLSNQWYLHVGITFMVDLSTKSQTTYVYKFYTLLPIALIS